MQFNREMIHTVRRIGKLVPNSAGTDLKLSDPALLEILRDLYGAYEIEEMKSLIERFFELAEQDLVPTESKDTLLNKVYRGRALVSEEASDAPSPVKTSTTKKKLTYRGREFEV
ncbi:MAG: hypothetical protein AAF542_05585 [Pseudomonadota bacterium]